MVDKDIVEYLVKNSKRGFSFERMKQSLLAQGKSDYDIYEAKKFVEQGGEKLDLDKVEKHFLRPRKTLFSSKLFVFSLLAFFVFLLAFLFFTLSFTEKSFSDKELSEGAIFGMASSNALVSLGDGGKNINLSRSNDSVTYYFGDYIGKVYIGEEELFDLDDDGAYDVIMTIGNYSAKGTLQIYFNKYVKCVPEWVCGSWGNCVNGLTKRVCEDQNSCNVSTGKPLEETSCELEVDEEEEIVEEENETEVNETDGNESVVNETEVNETDNLNYSYSISSWEITFDSNNFTSGEHYLSIGEKDINVFATSGDFSLFYCKSIEGLGMRCEQQVCTEGWSCGNGGQIYPFYLDGNLYFEWTDFLSKTGIYSYEVYLFSCDLIYDFFEIENCTISSEQIELILEINPLEYLKEEFEVGGEEVPLECFSTEDCNESETCDNGKCWDFYVAL